MRFLAAGFALDFLLPIFQQISVLLSYFNQLVLVLGY